MRIDSAGSTSWSFNGSDWVGRLASPAHWLGYLLTVIALLFGAPFWWDVLRRLTGVRSRSSAPLPPA